MRLAALRNATIQPTANVTYLMSPVTMSNVVLFSSVKRGALAFPGKPVGQGRVCHRQVPFTTWPMDVRANGQRRRHAGAESRAATAVTGWGLAQPRRPSAVAATLGGRPRAAPTKPTSGRMTGVTGMGRELPRVGRSRAGGPGRRLATDEVGTVTSGVVGVVVAVGPMDPGAGGVLTMPDGGAA